MNDFFNARAKILSVLHKKECSIEELFKKIELSDKDLCSHLDSLLELGILAKRKVGESLKYGLVEGSREKISSLLQNLKVHQEGLK